MGIYILLAVVLLTLCFFFKWAFVVWIVPLYIYGLRWYQRMRYGNADCHLCRRNKCKLDFSSNEFPFTKGKPVCKTCESRAKEQQEIDDEIRASFGSLRKTITNFGPRLREHLKFTGNTET